MKEIVTDDELSANQIKRTYIPGSEWLYFKIYTGTKSADRILTEFISPLTQRLKEENILSQYFFIRYTDIGFHLRFRIKLSSKDCFNAVFNQFYSNVSDYITNGLIWKIQCDTYERELERYGANTMECAESIFYADSENIVYFLNKLLNSPKQDETRWLFAIKVIDQTLDLFMLDMHEKYEFVYKFSRDFCYEFGLTGNNELKQLNDKFRAKRKIIENTMLGKEDIIQEVLLRRECSLSPFISHILDCQKKGTLEVSAEDFIRSILHMTMNRLFRSRNRLCEMTVYYMLMKYYKSVIAQNATR